MLIVWNAPVMRPTRDIDLLGRVRNSLHSIRSVIAEVCRSGDYLAQFDIALLLGHLDRRKIKAMWIVARSGENGGLIRTHGEVPTVIADRQALERSATPTSSSRRGVAPASS